MDDDSDDDGELRGEVSPPNLVVLQGGCEAPGLRERYFRPREQGSWEVSEALRGPCQFSQLNLIDSERVAGLGTFDLVVCRNVLVAMSARTRSRVLDSLEARVAPAGYLLIGHSERLIWA
jgi:chemotaxis protein methyltransferase CheR